MWKWLWRRRRLDDEFRDEIESHLALLVDRYVRSGMSRDAARAKAARQFGNVTWHREELHVMNGVAWIDALTQDLRYAFRQIRHSLGYSAVVAATLALGIGGTTAVFSVMHAILLAPLPYAQPGQLVRMYMQEPDNPATRRAGVSATHFTVLRERSASFTDVAGSFTRGPMQGLDLFHDGRGRRLRILHVTSDYFRTLRCEPFRGTGFAPDDETGPTDRTDLAGTNEMVGMRRVVLSDALWRAHFNADPSVVGATIHLSAEPYEISGVAAPGFKDPIVGEIDAWLPYNLAEDTFSQNYSLTVLGRMRNGATIEQARAELDVLSAVMKERWRDVRPSSIVAVPLHEDIVPATSRGLLQLLIVAVGLVLLVVCVTVANLVLVRATGRVHEFAIRSALGSGRRRLVSQLLVENAVLVGIGALLGLAVAILGVRALQGLGQDALPRLDAVSFNPAVLGFAVVVTLGVALASGVMPALRLTKIDPNRVLTQQSRSSTGGRWQGRVRSSLAAAQLALALALLAGAGVLSVSFHRLMKVDSGFRVDGVLTFDVSVPGVRYDAGRRALFHEELSRRLAAIPGVTAAGGTSRLPVTGTFHPWPLFIDSGPLAGGRVPQPQDPEHRTVSGEFFRALAIPVLAGRTFDDRDGVSAPMRAVISANLAKLAFPGLTLEAVVGQRVAVLGRKNRREIIGVVGDATIDVYGKPTSAVYSAHRQFAGSRNWALTQVVATDGEPEHLLPAVHAVVAAMDPGLVVHHVATMGEIVGRGSRRERFALVLMGVFAGVSLALAAIGLYGVLACTVRQRTTEIGIRIALGATAAHVRGLVLRQAALVLAVGIAGGIGAALALGRWLSSLLYQTNPWDPRIIATTATVLSIAAILAAWLPARRASHMDPTRAMQIGS